MRKFVSISQHVTWAADAICVESLFDLIEAQQRRLGDLPEFLRALIREAHLGVLAALDDLSVDDFNVFAALVGRVLGDWLANPREKVRYIYDVSVLVSMLARDPRSEDATHDPILHKIAPDSYYAIPLWASRFIWTNVIALLRERYLEVCANALSEMLDADTGFDLTGLNHEMLSEIQRSLNILRRLQITHGDYSTSLRLQECDVYVNDLSVLVSGLK